MNLLALVCVAALSLGAAVAPEVEATPAESAQPASTDSTDSVGTTDPTTATVAPAASPDPSPASAAAPPDDSAAASNPTPAPADPSWDATADGTASPADGTAAAAPVPVPAPEPAPPLPDRPIRWRLDLGLGGGSTVVVDRGYRAFSRGRNLGEGTAWGVFDFRLAQGRLFLGGGLSYQTSSPGGSVYGSLVNTEMKLHEPMVLGRVSVVAIDGIDAFGQVGVGPSFVQTQYYTEEGTEQDNVIPRFDVQGGLSLYLPKRWLPRKGRSRVSAGVQLGMGYTWRGKLEVRPTLYQDDEPIDATTAPLGTLNLHGLSWRASLFLRVM